MTNREKNFLRTITNEPGPSGYEDSVQTIWKKEVSKFCKNITKDVHNNLTAILNPQKDFSIMIVGHADEVGLIANYIDDNGYIYFTSIGGVDQSILGSQRARILTKNGTVEGVFGQKSLHLEEEKTRKIPKRHEVYIDVGAKDKKDASKYITIGDPIIYGEDLLYLHNDYVSARCFDNRIGIFIVAEALRKLNSKKFNTKVYGVSSVQEETGVWGARNAAYALKPSIAIALDVMPSTDVPNVAKEAYGDLKLGKGPVIRRGVISNKKVTSKMIEVAKKKKYKYQIDIENGFFGTDADPISRVRSGIAVGGLEIPTRYLHSSREVLNLGDVTIAINLLTDIILELDKDKKHFEIE